MPAWLSYTLLRIGLFAVAFAVLLLLGLDWPWAGLIATVGAFCISYIFFRKQRLALAEQWAARQPGRNSDDAAEDAGFEHPVPGAPGASATSAGDGERERRAEP